MTSSPLDTFIHQLIYFAVPLLACASAVGAGIGVLVQHAKNQICLRALNFSPTIKIAKNDGDWIKLHLHTHILLKYWLPLLVWLVVILIGSTALLSAEQTARFLGPFLRWLDPRIITTTIAAIHFTLRKLGHLTAYGILATLLWRALPGTLASTRSLAIASLVFMLSAFVAVSDEFHQSFVPSRTASLKDVLIDMCGALVGLTMCGLFAARHKPQIVY